MAPKLKVCNDEVRNSVTGIRENCGTEYEGEECPRRRNEHIRNMKTGFCHSKFCEGTKARSYSGQPAPTCKFWLVCPCDCHDIVSMMFQVNDLPRVLMENPEYVPYHMPQMMTLDERAANIAARKEEARQHRLEETRLLDGGDDIHSPSGRTRRGLLEQWVEFACKLWAVNPSVDCTPAWLSDTISMVNSVDPPSVGAIDSVLRRWVEVGYATTAQKPNRFTGFTPEGERLGLAVLKEKNRMQAKRYNAPTLRR